MTKSIIPQPKMECTVDILLDFLHRRSPHLGEDGVIRGASTIEKRFAYNLLEKLLHYVDKAQTNLKPKRDREY